MASCCHATMMVVCICQIACRVSAFGRLGAGWLAGPPATASTCCMVAPDGLSAAAHLGTCREKSKGKQAGVAQQGSEKGR